MVYARLMANFPCCWQIFHEVHHNHMCQQQSMTRDDTWPEFTVTEKSGLQHVRLTAGSLLSIVLYQDSVSASIMRTVTQKLNTLTLW
jgi:hypothetical protein